MSSLAFALCCGACAIVFALLLMRLLTGEWIWTTHNRESGPAPDRENKETK